MISRERFRRFVFCLQFDAVGIEAETKRCMLLGGSVDLSEASEHRVAFIHILVNEGNEQA